MKAPYSNKKIAKRILCFLICVGYVILALLDPPVWNISAEPFAVQACYVGIVLIVAIYCFKKAKKTTG